MAPLHDYLLKAFTQGSKRVYISYLNDGVFNAHLLALFKLEVNPICLYANLRLQKWMFKSITGMV